MKKIILHDYFETADGGGKLSLVLARGLGADLAYGFKSPRHPFFEDGFPGREIDLSCRSNLPLVRQFRLARAFERRTGFLADYGAAVYSGSYAPLAALSGSAGTNVLYCHTPPRFLYDQREHFFSLLPAWQRPALAAFLAWFKPRYEAAVARMDVIVANSENVRGRIREFLGRDAQVVHPPCETEKLAWLGQSDFYLSAARLDALKRVDIVVEAFSRMPDKRLVVISDGPERRRLERMARGRENIEIRGLVSDSQYRELMGECIATIYIPRDEDFGMTPVDSMAAGKPVIGVAEGGLTETVIDGETGILLRGETSPAALIEAVNSMSADRAALMRAACENRAARFDSSVFISCISDVISNL